MTGYSYFQDHVCAGEPFKTEHMRRNLEDAEVDYYGLYTKIAILETILGQGKEFLYIMIISSETLIII